MPNWIEGTLKLRGLSENLKRFFTEGIGVSTLNGEIKPLGDFITIDFECGFYEINFKNEPYIIGTRRAFITGEYVAWDSAFDTVAIEVKQAWSFKAEEFAKLSKKYHIDIKLFGFECGGQFNQNIEIHDGKIIYDQVITYDDYVWECPMPNMGG